MTQPITPYEAQARHCRAPYGKKRECERENVWAVAAALKIAAPAPASDDLPELDRAAMEKIERGVDV